MTARGFIGGLFTLIGWLLAILSGGCSLFYGLPMMLSMDVGIIGLVLIYGGIPFAVGLFLVWLGGRVRGRPPEQGPEAIADVFGEAGEQEKRPVPNPLKRED
jgi:hypothetical protein